MNTFENKQKMNNYLKYLMLLLFVAAASFAAHYLVVNSMDVSQYWLQSGYSLMGMYTFGVVSSFCVIVFVLVAQWAMPKKLGLVFLGAMTVKAIASYIYIHGGLGMFENDFLEYNFLIVFFIFLFLDVFVAFHVINQTDMNG